jgi:dephospho-CoA kinase
MERTILVVVGYIGSGKSEVSSYIKSLGIPMFRTGDVIRKAVLDSGKPLTPKNSEMMAVSLRKEHGNDYPARKTGERIEQCNEGLICVEGPRDTEEVDYLATLGKVILLVIEAPIELRFERARARKGSSLEPKSRDTHDYEEFKWRDQSENARGQREITHTDMYTRYTINNSGTKDELHKKVKKLIQEATKTH